MVKWPAIKTSKTEGLPRAKGKFESVSFTAIIPAPVSSGGSRPDDLITMKKLASTKGMTRFRVSFLLYVWNLGERKDDRL